jgi:ATP-binding cassette subfamily C (CFTR/MRP) protein 1
VLVVCSDAHVGRYIFDHCIRGSLSSKTRVLVTHQLSYLSECDYIVFLKDGEIAEQGSFTELMLANKEFNKLMTEFGGQAHDSVQQQMPDQQAAKFVAPSVKASPGSSPVEKKELMQIEDRARGGLSSSVYRYYFAALGGVFMVALCFMWLILQSVSGIIVNLFLSWLTDHKFNQSINWYLGIYAALSVATAIFTFLALLSLTSATVEAAKSLHDQSFLSLLMAPISFFDTTPIGRIMNRFSKDQEVIDSQLGESLRQFIAMFISAISVFIMMAVIEPLFLAALVPCLFVYLYFQNRYRRSNRELKRLDSITRSPLFAHFSETLTGLSTIRAYKLQQLFIQTNAERMEAQNRPHFIVLVDERW